MWSQNQQGHVLFALPRQTVQSEFSIFCGVSGLAGVLEVEWVNPIFEIERMNL